MIGFQGPIHRFPSLLKANSPLSDTTISSAPFGTYDAEGNYTPRQITSHDTSFADAIAGTMVELKDGQLVSGTVVKIDRDEVLLEIGYKTEGVPTKLTEAIIMLVILGLIDVVMISNLLIMVIVGGYETFVSRMYLEQHPDQPEWLSHVNASVLKVKLAMAIIGTNNITYFKSPRTI